MTMDEISEVDLYGGFAFVPDNYPMCKGDSCVNECTEIVKRDANGAPNFRACWHFLKWRFPLLVRVFGNPDANKMLTEKKLMR